MHKLRTFGILTALALFIAACGGPTPPGGTNHALTINVLPDESAGTVTVLVEGEEVTDTTAIPEGSEVTLQANAAAGFEFANWAGACTGTDASCIIPDMDADKEVTATFQAATPDTHQLTVAIAGDGTGTVEFETAGGDDAVGTHELADGTEVTLVATATTGDFSGWTGDACLGQGATCTFTIDSDATVTANFVMPGGDTFDLTVAVDGAGTGTVNFDTAAGADAVGTNTFDEGTVVTLVATATSGSFAGWTGDACSGQGATCAFTITADTSVTATFSDATPTDGSVAVAASGDDGIEWVTPANTGEPEHAAGFTHSTLEYAGLPYTNRYEAVTMSGFIFRDLGIPAGATITNAYIQFTSIIRTGNAAHVPSDNSTDIEVVITAGTSLNPDPIPQEADTAPLSTRATVASTQTWAIPDWVNKGEATALQQTPDLSALLNDLIAAGGWDETSDALFMIANNDGDATDGWRQIATYDESSDAAPVLHFSYTTP